MTEREWVASEDPNAMLLHIRRNSGRSDRRLGGEVAGYARWAAAYAVADQYMDAATNAGVAVYLAAGEDATAGSEEAAAQANLLRDIFGNPFRVEPGRADEDGRAQPGRSPTPPAS